MATARDGPGTPKDPEALRELALLGNNYSTSDNDNIDPRLRPGAEVMVTDQFIQQIPPPSFPQPDNSSRATQHLAHPLTGPFPSTNIYEGRRRQGAPSATSPTITVGRPSLDGSAIRSGSVHSENLAGSTRATKCILHDKDLAIELITLVDERIKDGVDPLFFINLRDMIMLFYREHARGPGDTDDDALEGSLMSQLSACRSDSVAAMFVDTSDRLFFRAGWRLRPSSQGPPGLSLPPRPQSRPRASTYLSTPPAKRKQHSSSPPTTNSRKRQNSALNSFSSAVSESRSSVSRILSEQVWCELCEKSYRRQVKYMRDYDMHFPHFFWVCIADDCDFYANRLDGVIGQHWGRKDHKDFLRGRDRKELEEQQRRNKFVIPDAGHQSCVYCDEDFDDSKNYVYRRDHHAKHVRDEDQDALDDRYKHRCTYPASCGMKDKYWRDSQYVLQNRIPVNEYRRQLGLGDTFTQSDGDDDYDESIHDNASQPHHGSGGIGRGERTRSAGSGSNRRVVAVGSHISSNGGPLDRLQLYPRSHEDLDTVPALDRTVSGFLTDPDSHWTQPRSEGELRSHQEEITGGSDAVPVPLVSLELDLQEDPI